MPPTRAIGLFWLLYMAGMGLVFPYQTLYFRENAGLSGFQLGLVLAVRPLVAMLAQPAWGQLADRSGARGRVLTVLTLGAALGYLLLPQARGFPMIVAAMAFAALFSTSVIPMSTAVSMAALGDEAPQRFGRVRVWGTVGFLATVLALPPLLDRIQEVRGWQAAPGGPTEPGLGLLFVGAAALTLVATIFALRLPRGGAMAVRARRGDLRLLLRHPPYRRALAVAFLAFLFLQGPIQLFPIFVTDRGGSLATLSLMWIPMLLVEIPLVFLTGSTLKRIGARGLVMVGVLADGLRWLGSALAPNLTVIFGLQLLHGAVVAGLIVGIQLYVESVVPERLRATGQTLIAMIGISLGGMLSNLCGGLLIDGLGVTTFYLIGGSAAVVLGLLVPLLLPPPTRSRA